MTPPLDAARAAAFADSVLRTLNAGTVALMISLGHRLGLFDVLAGLPPSTSDGVARAAKLDERYVREWLGAMTVAGIVTYDGARRRYVLPAEHAACLTRAAAPGNMASYFQYVGILGGVEDQVLEAFRHGKGVPYAAYPRFQAVMAEDSAQTVAAVLHDHVVPLVPRLRERLAAGIHVLDVGCGSGHAMVELAAAWPQSRFHGCDVSTEAIDAARTAARGRGVRNVAFEVADAAEPLGTARWDVITAFDAIHDQPRPDRVLANVRAGLRGDGVFLMQDIALSSDLAQNLAHPLAPFLYAVSCMHCMSVSLAAGGPGLGATWGRETALAMLRAAGFTTVDVHSLPHDVQNLWYVARP